MFGLTIGGVYGADRARLHDGLRHLAADQLRPWRHYHDRRLLGVLPGPPLRHARASSTPIRSWRWPASSLAVDGGVHGHRADRRAHLLPAVPPCRHARAADLRDRRVLRAPAHLPRHVRLERPLLSRSRLDGGQDRLLRLLGADGAADRDRDRARSPCSCSISSCRRPGWAWRCGPSRRIATRRR